MNSLTKTIVIVIASVVVAAGATGVAVAATSRHAAPQVATVPGPLITTTAAPETPTGSISNGAAVTSDQALAFLAHDTAEFSKVSSSYAMTMTLGQLSSQSSFNPQNAISADETVIVAISVGGFVPGYAHGEKFTWGAMVIDQNNGVLIGTFANPGDVPAFLAQ